MKKLLCTIVCIALNTACGSSPEVETSIRMPKWAINQPELCGLGVQKMRGNIGTDRRYSIARGRADLSSQIETKVKSMIRSYEASGEESSKDFTEELTRSAAINLSKTTLNGSIPAKLSVIDNNIFTLVCLKPDVLTNEINKMNMLNNAQKAALRRRAKIAHQELEDQMERYDD